jgi:hypothetical protein
VSLNTIFEATDQQLSLSSQSRLLAAMQQDVAMGYLQWQQAAKAATIYLSGP